MEQNPDPPQPPPGEKGEEAPQEGEKPFPFLRGKAFPAGLGLLEEGVEPFPEARGPGVHAPQAFRPKKEVLSPGVLGFHPP